MSSVKRKEIDYPRGKLVLESKKKAKRIDEDDYVDKRIVNNKHKRIYIEQINVKNIPIGSIIVGCIQDIQDFEIKVVLPGCVYCLIPIVNISSDYTRSLREFAQNPLHSKKPLKPQSMFKIGQQVIIKVLEKKNEKILIDETFIPYVQIIGTLDPDDIYEELNSKIFLSACDNFIISASVKSKEDHGYVMNCGVNKIIGFLHNDKARMYIENLKVKSLSIGQVITCAILNKNENNVLQLSAEPNDLINLRIDDSIRGRFPSSCLLPGLNVKAKIVDIQDAGLEIMLYDEFPGYILKDHLNDVWNLPESNYEIDSDLNATILYQNLNTKHVVCTLRNNFEQRAISNRWKLRIGQIFEKATVVSIDKKGNVTFKLVDNIKAIAPFNELSDDYLTSDDLSTIMNMFPIKSKHSVRVKSYSFIDGYVKVTVKPSLVYVDEVALDDLHIGSVIRGKVKQLNKEGLVLKIGFAARAFVPKLHLTENPIGQKSLDKLFPLHKEVKGRVFRLDKTANPPKVCLTLKKSLLSSSLYILDDYDKAKAGVQTDGMICLIKDDGLLLEFFNRLRAWVSKVYVLNSDLSVYNVGQIVKCTIIKVEKENRKIYASLT